MISLAFNKKFHATLSDIIESNKTLKIERGGTLVKIDTKKIDINGIKILFKILDEDYPKQTGKTEVKTKISRPKLDKLYSIFGIPKSITEITSGQLTDHMTWIQSVCADNNIKIHDDVWDALLEKAIKYGY